MVRLQLIRIERRRLENSSLNSTMVRLQRFSETPLQTGEFLSQFHYGSITTRACRDKAKHRQKGLNSTMVRLQL